MTKSDTRMSTAVATLGLKIDVRTFHGAKEGVPRLLETLTRQQAGATFFFNLGPARSDRALGKILRPLLVDPEGRNFFSSHYGVAAWLRDTLLPAPDVGHALAPLMREVLVAGFEVGILAWNRSQWEERVATAPMQWAEKEMRRAVDRYKKIFNADPHCHAAPSWQMNRQALRLTQRLDFYYSADCRGTHPFRPVWDGEPINCPQVPTTLPTLCDLLCSDCHGMEQAAARLIDLTKDKPASGHVYTLSTELEGLACHSTLNTLLEQWKDQGYILSPLKTMVANMDSSALPWHEVYFAPTPGQPGRPSLTQGDEFLSHHDKT